MHLFSASHLDHSENLLLLGGNKNRIACEQRFSTVHFS